MTSTMRDRSFDCDSMDGRDSRCKSKSAKPTINNRGQLNRRSKDSGFHQESESSHRSDDSGSSDSASSSDGEEDKGHLKKENRTKKNEKTKSKSRSRPRQEDDESEDDSDSASSSSSSSDCMMPIVVRRKRTKRKLSESESRSSAVEDCDSIHSKDTAPVTSDVSIISSNKTSFEVSESSRDSEKDKDGSESPETPEGQWEVERIVDYVKDNYGEQYNVKWEGWDACFNTWEPPANLLNCVHELIRFRNERKAQVKEALTKSEYVVLPSGKRRRKGPPILDIPPDPRPFDEKVQDFFNITGASPNERYIRKVFRNWKAKKYPAKTRFPMNKVEKLLEEGIDGNLSSEDVKALTRELVIREVEAKASTLKNEIKRWEVQINKITESTPQITIENDVDLMGPPIGFEFVNDYVAGEGVVIPKDPPVGCGCSGPGSCYDSRASCCASQFGYKYAYTRFGKVNVMQGSPIYECNSKCQCGPDCPNRVVQDGKSSHKLSIFRTNDGRGWGVKTLKTIKKGSFVTLYVGEVIKSEEANRRGQRYDKTGVTYLFDLDFNDPDNYPYSVDASKYGNVAHFINHSCMPNLAVYAVWTDCLDPNLPKLALFAVKDIARDEELTFDYNVQLHSESHGRQRQDETLEDNRPLEKRTVCLCGTPKCRKFIF